MDGTSRAILPATGSTYVLADAQSRHPNQDLLLQLMQQQKNICPLIKGTYEFAVSGHCPFTYFADLIIGETTCDGKKKMYELLNDIKDVHVMNLPHARNAKWAPRVWREECVALKEELERRYDIEITDEML